MNTFSKKSIFILSCILVLVGAIISVFLATGGTSTTNRFEIPSSHELPKDTVLITPVEHKKKIYITVEEYCKGSFDDCETDTPIEKNGKKYVRVRDQYFTGFTATYSDGKQVTVPLPSTPKIGGVYLKDAQLVSGFPSEWPSHKIQFHFPINNISPSTKITDDGNSDVADTSDEIKIYNPSETKYISKMENSHLDQRPTSTEIKDTEGNIVARVSYKTEYGEWAVDPYWINDDLLLYPTTQDQGLVVYDLTTQQSNFISYEALDQSSSPASKKYLSRTNLYDHEKHYSARPYLHIEDIRFIDGKTYILRSYEDSTIDHKNYLVLVVENLTDKKEVWIKPVPTGKRLESAYLTDDLTALFNLSGTTAKSIYTDRIAGAYYEKDDSTKLYEGSYIFPTNRDFLPVER